LHRVVFQSGQIHRLSRPGLIEDGGFAGFATARSRRRGRKRKSLELVVAVIAEKGPNKKYAQRQRRGPVIIANA